ncbi:MAG: hypothetical protein WB788_01015 [Thermoplasmata archaeon]|nr:hypothetical protein [Thermoplasmata archaeon]
MVETERPDRTANSVAPTTRTRAENARERIPRVLIKLLAVYSAIFVSFIVAVVLIGSHDPRARAIILMAAGLVVLWVLLGGLITLRFRDRIRLRLLRIPLRWEWTFFLLATALALIEEAITTTMTNLAPEFGSQIGMAYITASNNYLIVIAFSSVVVFVPEFAGWVLLLRRYSFTPNEVFLLYGFLGTTMEASLSPTAFISGFWFFVYGLMVFLPAYSLPTRARAVPPRWFHYVLAYFLPLACALPVIGADTLLAHALGIHLWS